MNSDLETYFRINARLWAPTSVVGRCLGKQRRALWETRFLSPGTPFVTLGVEGSGHHWLHSLPKDVCGATGCGGLGSFSECGDCCDVDVDLARGRVKYRKRKGGKGGTSGVAWRCFESDAPRFPKVDDKKHNVVLLRDVTASHESALRRFWQFRNLTGGQVDTLAREESMQAKALGRLETNVARLDCRRTLFLSFEPGQQKGAKVSTLKAPYLKAQFPTPFQSSYLGTSDHLSSSSRTVHAFSDSYVIAQHSRVGR